MFSNSFITMLVSTCAGASEPSALIPGAGITNKFVQCVFVCKQFINVDWCHGVSQ